MRIVWLGHSFFEIRTTEAAVLIDPWLSNPMFPGGFEVKDYDLVVVTHAHGDHVGEAVELLRKNRRARFVGVYELARALEEKGVDPQQLIGANIGGPVDPGLGGLRVVLTPAAHSSEVGIATGVILLSREATVYHAGDTGLTKDMEVYAEVYRPDIYLVPIGGHYTMDALQAAYSVRMVRPKVAIPMHYGTFPVLYGQPEEFREYVTRLYPETRVVELRPGEPFYYP